MVAHQVLPVLDRRKVKKIEYTEKHLHVGLDAVFGIFKLWGLTDKEASRLLGRPSAKLFRQWKHGDYSNAKMDKNLLNRINHILAIYKALAVIYSKKPGHADTWIRQECPVFDGGSALDRMMTGVRGISNVRGYLASVCAGIGN